MKKTIFDTLFILLSATSLLFASCELESSGNGNMDGYWRLSAIDTLQTDGSKDMTQSGQFWAVQGSFFQIGNTIMRHRRESDSLFLYDMRIHDRELGDTLITDTEHLSHIGIHTLTPTFKVLRLSSSDMVLSNKTYKYRLTKF